MRSHSIVVITTSLASVLFAVSAHAGAARTFLSAAGSDANNCANVVSPCRHLAAAYAATAPNGEIYVLDPANYGSVNITVPVSIEGHGWASIAPTNNSAAITIDVLAGNTVNIIGVVIDGAGSANSTGISVINSAATVTIQDSVIRNVTNDGIQYVPTGGSGSIAVANTFIANNGSYGVFVQPLGSASATATFDHVRAQYNGAFAYGIALSAVNTTGTVSGTATDTVSSNNGGGFDVEGAGANLTVMRSVATYNHTGVQAGPGSGNNGTMIMGQMTITNNLIACNVASSALYTFGDNSIVGGSCLGNSIAKQ